MKTTGLIIAYLLVIVTIALVNHLIQNNAKFKVFGRVVKYGLGMLALLFFFVLTARLLENVDITKVLKIAGTIWATICSIAAGLLKCWTAYSTEQKDKKVHEDTMSIEKRKVSVEERKMTLEETKYQDEREQINKETLK